MKKYLFLFGFLITTLISFAQPCISYVTYNVYGNDNIIYWWHNSSPHYEKYKIYRQDSTLNYIEIGEADALDSMYEDSSINPSVQFTKYKFSIVDSSGNISTLTPSCTSVLLEVNSILAPNIYNLKWNKYYALCGMPINYYILRGQSQSTLSIIDSITSIDTLSFSDTLSPTYLTYIDSNSFVGAYYQIGYNINTYTNGLIMGYSNYYNTQNTNIHKYVSKNEISIYPNPFNDYTTVTFKNTNNKLTTIIVIDIFGNIVRTYNNVYQKNIKIYKEALNSGLYFVKIINDNIEKYKLIVE